MKNSITENEIEEIALSYLLGLGYTYQLGTVISPDGEHPERQYNEVMLVTRLRDAIDKLNPTLSQDAKEDALKKVLRTESPNQQRNISPLPDGWRRCRNENRKRHSWRENLYR